jgi:hypothetical protein
MILSAKRYRNKEKSYMGIPTNFDKVYREKFKELLLPQGFSYKQDMFIRVVGGEVIQLISRLKRNPYYYIRFGIQSLYSSVFEKFLWLKSSCSNELDGCILGLEMTGYAPPELSRDCWPKDSDMNYCVVWNHKEDRWFTEDEADPFFTRAVHLTQKHLISIFDSISNVQDLINYQKRTTLLWGMSNNDLVVVRDRDDFQEVKQKWLFYHKEMVVQGRYGCTYEEIETQVIDGFDKFISRRDKVLNNPEILTKTDAEIQRIAETNRMNLRSWGIEC